jgi:hypothetical protein
MLAFGTQLKSGVLIEVNFHYYLFFSITLSWKADNSNGPGVFFLSGLLIANIVMQ